MWNYKLFVMLTFLCARVTCIDGEIHLSDAVGELMEKLEDMPEDILSTDSDYTTGTQEKFEGKQCGGLGGFLRCLLVSKIKSFRQEISQVAFPDTSLGVFQQEIMESKIDGSLDEWLEKLFDKEIEYPDED